MVMATQHVREIRHSRSSYIRNLTRHPVLVFGANAASPLPRKACLLRDRTEGEKGTVEEVALVFAKTLALVVYPQPDAPPGSNVRHKTTSPPPRKACLLRDRTGGEGAAQRRYSGAFASKRQLVAAMSLPLDHRLYDALVYAANNVISSNLIATSRHLMQPNPSKPLTHTHRHLCTSTV